MTQYQQYRKIGQWNEIWIWGEQLVWDRIQEEISAMSTTGFGKGNWERSGIAKDFTPQPPLPSSPIPNSHGSFSGLTCCLLPSSNRFTSLASPPSRRVVASEVPPVLARLARASFPTCELLAVLILAYITRRNISTKPMIAWVSILFTEGSVLTNGLQEESETIMSLRLI